jgi:hypothetical protein
LTKAHLAVIHSDDDTYIQQCLDAAEAHCAAIMNRTAIADAQPAGSEWLATPDDVVPKPVVQAILAYCAEFYEHRTAGVTGTIYTRMPAADALLHFQRLGLGV